MTESRTNVLQHCRVSPPPGSVAGNTLALTFFDLFWLIHPPISRLLIYDLPCSTSHFTTTLIPNIKHSLSLALKYFFPLAGNLIIPSNISITTPEIRYSEGDSVSLTFAECTDKDLNHISGYHARDADELFLLVPQLSPTDTKNNNITSTPPVASVLPVLAIQVTLFPDQGICIGLTNSHVVADGSSIFSFIKSWASISFQLISNSNSDENGDDEVTLIHDHLPFYDRSVIKDPKGLATIMRNQLAETEECFDKIQTSPPPMMNKLVRSTFIMRQTDIQKLKSFISNRRPKLVHVSSFTVVCAYLWTCLAKALVINEDDVSRDHQAEFNFRFAIDCRGRLEPRVPATYFGNCVTGCFLRSKISELLVKEQGLIMAAELIGQGLHWRIHNEEGGVLQNVEVIIPNAMDAKKRSTRGIGVAGSPNFDYYAVDFGWGKPKKFEFVSEPLFLSRFKDSQDLEIGLCLPKDEMDVFSVAFTDGIEGPFEDMLVN